MGPYIKPNNHFKTYDKIYKYTPKIMSQNLQNIRLIKWVLIEIIVPYGSTYEPKKPQEKITTT
jgi:hypothetical protein